MKTTLMKYLLIAAIAPAMAATQEPPTPPTPPKPRESMTPPKAVRPPTPPTPKEWSVDPKFDLNFNYDYKFDEMKWKLDELNSGRVKAALEKASEMRFEIEPKIQIALENSKLDRDFQLDLQRASREAERAMQESSREIQRAQLEMQ